MNEPKQATLAECNAQLIASLRAADPALAAPEAKPASKKAAAKADPEAAAQTETQQE